MLKDLRELEKDINFIKLELEKNLSNEDKNLLLTLMDLQNIKQKRLWDLAYIRIDKDKIQDSDGKIIGKLYVYIDNKLYKTVDLELKEKVKKSNFLELLGSIFSNIL